MNLTEDQQAELSKILDNPTFKAAKEQVLNMTDSSIDGLLAPEAAIKMANEKGVRNAFRLLLKITKPVVLKNTAPQQRTRLTR